MSYSNGLKQRIDQTATQIHKIVPTARAGGPRRLRIDIGGAVQGVGFRPFVYRAARELGVSGWVRNHSAGVICEAEAHDDALERFLQTIRDERPPLADIHDIACTAIDPCGSTRFEILTNRKDGPVQALALPDIATCPDCLGDIFDPGGRRYLYPFTNCTNCGPRYSIIAGLPYDRANTAMTGFSMCSQCSAEYSDPRDRRFHAQPNCCPDCGPQLSFLGPKGALIARKHEAILQAVGALQDGKTVTVKGLGGFLLLTDARNGDAVRTLRERKHRPDKPFAIMCADIAAVKAHARVSAQEADLLESPQSPIVLLARRCATENSICGEVAPRNSNLGVMLPYTPLHHILMRALGFPVVATSGNLSSEPLAYDNQEAMNRLGAIADFFLLHDRPILAPVDDSVARVMGDAPVVLRRARGYSPYPLPLNDAAGKDGPTILAVGGHLSNTVCLLKGSNAFVGPHIGDLETPEAVDAFERSVEHLCAVNDATPDAVACDMHADYRSSHYAQKTGLRLVPVQHHVAHLAACMAEHHMDEPVLGIAWDGTGLGDDGTLWGGEFFHLEPGRYRRIAHLHPFRLPGGAAAIREPRRTAIGVLWALDGELKPDRAGLAPVADLTEEECRIFADLLSRGVNAPVSSSAGRLFDAAAALTGLRLRTTYQGQAAGELEWALKGTKTDQAYRFALPPQSRWSDHAPLVLDWRPMIEGLLDDLAAAAPVPVMAAKFHNTLVEMIAAVVEWQKIDKVIVSGGCFQNKYLSERVMQRLAAMDIKLLFPRTVPPNDGGLSFGQAFWARHMLKGKT